MTEQSEIKRLNKVGAEIMLEGQETMTFHSRVSFDKFTFDPCRNTDHFLMVAGKMREKGWEFIIFLYKPNGEVSIDCWHPDRKISEERISVTAEDQTNLALAGMRCIEKAVKELGL